MLSSWIHLLPASSASFFLSSGASEGEMTSASSLGCGPVSAQPQMSVWPEPKQTLSSTQEDQQSFMKPEEFTDFSLPSRLILELRHLQNEAHNLGYMLHALRILSCPSGTQNALLMISLHLVSFPQCPCLCPCPSKKWEERMV